MDRTRGSAICFLFLLECLTSSVIALHSPLLLRHAGLEHNNASDTEGPQASASRPFRRPYSIPSTGHFPDISDLRPSYTEHEPMAGTVFRMFLRNHGDVEYTGLVYVGDQALRAIVDTGSFDLLVFSTKCIACGYLPNLYNGSHSSSYSSTEFEEEQDFGSGSCISTEARDKVRMGPMTIAKQVFWEVIDTDMQILTADSFQAILGVGPPNSSVKFAEDAAQQVREELDAYQASGQRVPEQYESTVAHYDEAVEHARKAISVVGNLGMDAMSICLQKDSLAGGAYMWHDPISRAQPHKFLELPITGDIYWSLNLTRARLGSQMEGGQNFTGAESERRIPLGCDNETCSAIIDTGTSLIVAPTHVVIAVKEAISKWSLEGGTCRDLSALPDLNFELNNHHFSLPPEAYVGKIHGSLGNHIRSFMPHVASDEGKRHEQAGCELLLMTMDVESQFGMLWILGMPFFRKYYTTFRFEKGLGTHRPQPSTMAFSEADSNCEPGVAAGQRKHRVLVQQERRKASLNIDGARIRVPPFLRRAKPNVTDDALLTRTVLQHPFIHI